MFVLVEDTAEAIAASMSRRPSLSGATARTGNGYDGRVFAMP